jgi:hypothetical protein
MREKKIHVKIKNKPACGVKGKKLKYVDDDAEVTCGRCIKAVEK